jgi:hypothetical protein
VRGPPWDSTLTSSSLTSLLTKAARLSGFSLFEEGVLVELVCVELTNGFVGGGGEEGGEE